MFYASYANKNLVIFDDFSTLLGGKSTPLEIEQSQGLTQGSPCSMILFTIVMSVKLDPIREKYKGVACIPAYADDLTIIAKSALVSKNVFYDIRDTLNSLALNISLEKSTICAVKGSEKVCENLAAQLKIAQVKSVHLLGAIAFSHDTKEEAMKQLIKPIIAKIDSIIALTKDLISQEAEIEVLDDEADNEHLEKQRVIEPSRKRIHGLMAKLYQAFLAGPAQTSTYLYRVMPPSWSNYVWDMMDAKIAEFFSEFLLTQPNSIEVTMKDGSKRNGDFAPFRIQREALKAEFSLPGFARGGTRTFDYSMTGKFESERRAQTARLFIPLCEGGAGLPNSQTRAVAGFTSSANSGKETVIRLARKMDPEVYAVSGLPFSIALVKRELAVAKHITENYLPAKNTYAAIRSRFDADLADDKRSLQSTITKVFNLVTRERIIGTLSAPQGAGAEAAQKAAIKVSSFVSSASRGSFEFVKANQNFIGNLLTSDEYRAALCKHVGLDPPLHDVCMACMESYDGMGAYHHSTCCKQIGTAAFAKHVKDGAVLGLKGAFGVSIPRGEPDIANQPGMSRKNVAAMLELNTEVPVKSRADFAVTSGGTTFLVDSTSGVSVPASVTAKAMRCVGLHASMIEAKKRLEYRAWRFGYPNEFVPFAMDNTGMLSKSSLRFLSRMRNHAKRLHRFRGLTRFWEAMSIGLAKGSAHGFALMSRGVGVKNVRVVNG